MTPDPTRSVAPDDHTSTVTPTLRPDGSATADPNATRPVVIEPATPPDGFADLTELGRGAMGVVYRATQPGLNRPVAVKMLLGEAADPKHALRFLAEAEAVAAVDHPHVVRVYEFGRRDGRPFISMEYLPGGTLADHLKASGGRLPTAAATRLVEKLARGVAAAHAAGIVHRDLKPGNVLFDAAGEPKVTDFGLAKRGTGADLTRTNAIVGTPAYMSPEQARGEGKFVGPPADVWALGVILYECLTGCRPFDAPNTVALLHEVVNTEPPSLRSRVGDVPRDLEQVVAKCLRKEPGERYPSAVELADDLRRHLSGEPVRARPVPATVRAWKWARRNPAPALLFACLMVMGAVLPFTTLLMARANRLDRDLLAAQSDKLTEETARAGAEAKAAAEAKKREEAAKAQATAEGKAADEARKREAAATAQAAAEANAAGEAQRREREAKESALAARRMLGRVAAAEGQRRADEGDALQALAWFARSLEVVPEDSVSDLARDRIAAYRSYGRLPMELFGKPDWKIGNILLKARQFGMREIRLSSNREGMFYAQVLDITHKTFSYDGDIVTPPMQHAEPVNDAVFSPDGRRVVTASADCSARVWDAATGMALTLPMRHAGSVGSAAFSPDGRLVVTLCGRPGQGSLYAQLWDTVTGIPVTTPLPCPYTATARAGFSPDGRRVFIAYSDINPFIERIWDLSASVAVTPPLLQATGIQAAVFSPDGRRIAVAGRDRTSQVWDIATKAPVTPPMPHVGLVNSVAFSPEGRRVATSDRYFTARVWDATTGQPITPPLQHQDVVTSAVFSPDGRRVVTASFDGTARVWDATTGVAVTPRLRHGRRVTSAAFSPDSRRVATASSDNTGLVWDAATGVSATPPMPHKDTVNSVAFSSDGRLVATASDDRTARVWDAATGVPATPPLQHTGGVKSVAFSPNGPRVVTASGDRTARVWDTATGAAVTPQLQHAAYVSSAGFSPDGRRVATASGDGTARVWDAVTGVPVTPLLRHTSFLESVAFSPDGRRLLTACEDGTARVWELPTDARPAADLIKLAHLYAGGRVDDAGGFVPLTHDETKTLFAELSAKYPADFTVPPARAAAWHREQAAAAEKDRDAFAAAFHLRVLLKDYAPADPALTARLRHAEAGFPRERLPLPRPAR